MSKEWENEMSKLKTSWDSSINAGQYHRKDSQFRNWITTDGQAGITGEAGFKAEANRYHLYVSLACPWAHRTLIFRQLKGLENIITVSVVHPDMFENGWSFKHTNESEKLYGTTGDTLYDSQYLSELYFQNVTNYDGVVSVPVLWDKKKKVIVNNESAEIIRMFNCVFNHITGNELDFYPLHLQAEIKQINELVYNNINNGVYKAGFATNQQAYEQSVMPLFSTLQTLNNKLAEQRYLAGNELTEADWRLWSTLIRFDAVYHTHFKCNLSLIKEFKHLYQYMLELYQIQGIAQTVNMAHIKRHYYASHLSINSYGIVPLGHHQDWKIPHQREQTMPLTASSLT